MDKISNFSSKVKFGIFWNTYFRIISTFVRFIGTVFLARLLAPSDFGLVAMAMLTIGFLTKFGQFGFQLAYIQFNGEVEKRHLDNLFLLDFSFKFMIWLGIFFLSSFISNTIFSEPRLAEYLPIVSFYIVIECFSTTPLAYLQRRIEYKKYSLILNSEFFITAPIAITMAYLGYGIWSLIYSRLIGTFIVAITSMIVTNWYPTFRFDRNAARDLFNFGALILIRNLIKYGADNVDYFFVSRFWGAQYFGFYEKAYTIMRMPYQRLIISVNKVIFSAFSHIQNQPNRIKKIFRKIVTTISLLSYPMLCGLSFISPYFVVVVLGEKWAPTIFPLQVMCVAGIVKTLDPIINSVLTATGYVKVTISRFIVELILIGITTYISVPYGINYISMAVTISSLLILIFNLYLLKKYSKINLLDFFLPQIPAIASTATMLLILFLTLKFFEKYLNFYSSLGLFLLVGTGMLSYLLFHFIFRFKVVVEAYNEVLSSFLKKKKSVRC